MIKGLEVTVKGTELRGLCETRAAYLEKRSGEYAKQAALFPDDQHDTSPGASNTSSPRKNLQDKADDYSDRGRQMRFIAGHLVDAEDYQLDMGDLATLGITKRGY